MDQVHVVRHKVLVEGQGLRQVAREMGLSRNTVKRYLEIPEPVRIESRPRRKPVAEKVQPRIDALLEEAPRWTGGKQQLTATRLHELLRAEGLDVGVTLVKHAVAEARRRRREVFVPLVYQPGELAEVDFFEVLVDVAGVRRKAWMFVMRLMYSGRDFAWLYSRQDQVSFLDGHVRAFCHFGVVPHRIAYDNLRAAVRKILLGSERELTDRFEALCSHYLFEASFCRPYTGHDKGGVEARGKGIRLQHLVPIPTGDRLDAISTQLLQRLDDGLVGGKDSEGRSRGDRFADERRKMLPLPRFRFRARRTYAVGVSRRSLVKVEGAHYSVPCEWAGLDVTVYVGPSSVEIAGPARVEPFVSVLHPRVGFGERSIDYRHYVRELSRKPQAIRQVAAELVRDLGEPFSRAWRALLDAHGPKQAPRIFAKVLAHVEVRGATAVGRILDCALARNEPVLLALAPSAPPAASLPSQALPQRLCDVQVATAYAADYDTWLVGGAA